MNTQMPEDTPDVLRALSELTEQQHQALLHETRHVSGVTQFALVDFSLKWPNTIATMFTLRWDRLTKFGEDVRRAALREQEAARLSPPEELGK